LDKYHVSNDATENAWFLSNLIWSLAVRVAVWHRFLAVWGLKEAPWAPVT
jgi:hypothetical protein